MITVFENWNEFEGYFQYVRHTISTHKVYISICSNSCERVHLMAVTHHRGTLWGRCELRFWMLDNLVLVFCPLLTVHRILSFKSAVKDYLFLQASSDQMNLPAIDPLALLSVSLSERAYSPFYYLIWLGWIKSSYLIY